MPRNARPASATFVLATMAIDALTYGVLVPITPDLVRSLGHFGPGQAARWIGLMLTGFAAMQLVAAPILGALSDRFGRRPILLLSLTGISVNCLLMAWAPSLGWLLAIRMAAGATAGNVSAAMAYIADVTPPEQRAARYGAVGAMFSLGFVVGPALGGLLGSISLRLPFLAAAGLAAANALYGLVILPESLAPGLRRPFEWRRAHTLGALRSFLRDAAARRLGLAWCCLWFAIGAMQSSFILSNEQRFHWGPERNGALMAASGVLSGVVQIFVVSRLVARLGEPRAAVAGFAVNIAAFLLFAIGGAPWVVILGSALSALGAVGGPPIQAILSARAGPDRQGEVQGALSALQGMTMVLAPLATGWIFAAVTGSGAGPAGSSLIGLPFLLAAASFMLGTLALASRPVSLALRPHVAAVTDAAAR